MSAAEARLDFTEQPAAVRITMSRVLTLCLALFAAEASAAKSKLWRRIIADVFNAEAATLKVSEGAAYGAALQALWCWRLQQGDKVKIENITDEFVALNTDETATPKKEAVAAYREL